MGNAPFILAIGALWVMAWWNIFSKAGFPGAFSLLMLVPILNVFLFLMLAFFDWPAHAELAQLRDFCRDKQRRFPPTSLILEAASEPIAVCRSLSSQVSRVQNSLVLSTEFAVGHLSRDRCWMAVRVEGPNGKSMQNDTVRMQKDAGSTGWARHGVVMCSRQVTVICRGFVNGELRTAHSAAGASIVVTSASGYFGFLGGPEWLEYCLVVAWESTYLLTFRPHFPMILAAASYWRPTCS